MIHKRLNFSLSFILMAIVLASVACQTPQRTSNSDSNNSCTFDGDCLSGNCEFGTCSAFSKTTSIDSPPMPDTSPKMVIPATGGPPVLGIPAGGDTYIPTTGGDPIIGIPTGP